MYKILKDKNKHVIEIGDKGIYFYTHEDFPSKYILKKMEVVRLTNKKVIIYLPEENIEKRASPKNLLITDPIQKEDDNL